LPANLDEGQIEKLEYLKSLYLKQTSIEIDRIFFYAFKRGAMLLFDATHDFLMEVERFGR